MEWLNYLGYLWLILAWGFVAYAFRVIGLTILNPWCKIKSFLRGGQK